MKTLSLRYLCSAMILLGSMHLTATESDMETKPVVTETSEETKVSSDENEQLVPAGTREVKINERLNIQTRLYQENKANLVSEAAPKKETLKNLLKAESAQFKFDDKASVTYATTHPGAFHFMYSVGLNYETLVTEDGNVWRINPYDSYKIMNWLSTDTVVVMRNHPWFFSSYGYCLVNLNTDTAVEATISLYVKPQYHTVFNHRVALIDDLRQMIWLEDGSVWSVMSADYNPIHWQIGDTVVIGINDSWYMEAYPNILINAVTLLDVRARCIHY